MKQIYIFNNECEMAIANELPHYSPPRNIVQMRQELSCIMSYFCSNGDYVLCDRKPDNTYIELMRQLGINVNYITNEELKDTEIDFSYIPWGNAPNIARDMEHLHITPHHQHWQPEMRERVSRCAISACVKTWNKTFPNQLIPEMHVAKTINEVVETATQGPCVVKAPWSSSGKGVLFIKNQLQPKEKEWISGILKKQQCVTIETCHEKLADFGLEYFIDSNGEITFLGSSQFYTGENGTYSGNRIASESEIIESISIEIQLINQVSYVLKESVAKWYRGFLGVDMLKTVDGFIPFIEINYRLNMGILALRLYEKICSTNAQGIFTIKQYAPGVAAQYYSTQRDSCQFNENGKLLKGTLALTPIYEHTRFVAEIAID